MSDILGKIAVIDDDGEMRSLLTDFLKNQRYDVISFSEAKDALAYTGPIDLVISDINMPGINGLEFTAALKKNHPEIPVILITAFGSIETAIEAMKRGAFDYVTKPFKLAEMAVNVERAMEHRRLKAENTVLKKEISKTWSVGEILGKSAAMKSVFDLIDRVAVATANVLITGESGTGKEIVAREIHRRGPRHDKPFVAINCTAIPETLLESELFGHAKGSFTGAIQRKRGLFEEAEGGTLFLDEIGDMDPSLQSKLLRVLQEKKVRPVGDNVSKDINVRIIAATHKDLKAAIKDGRFRDDLFYRLSVIPIVIPPLRQRQDDIPLLAEHFLRKYTVTNQLPLGSKSFSKRAMQKLMGMRWEGNVRELENLIERLVVLTVQPQIEESDIPSSDTQSPDQFFMAATQDFPTVEQLEKRYMQIVLEKTGGRKDKAAQILGMNRRTLYRKEREYGFISQDTPEEQDQHETEGEFSRE